MSKYVIYYSSRKDMYRKLATYWVKFAEQYDISEEQHRGMSIFFRYIARRFGLTQEFRDIGVI